MAESRVEEWPFVDDRELMSFKGLRSCASCTHFGYVTLGQCQTLGACLLMQRLLPPNCQQLRQCQHWSYAAPAALGQSGWHRSPSDADSV